MFLSKFTRQRFTISDCIDTILSEGGDVTTGYYSGNFNFELRNCTRSAIFDFSAKGLESSGYLARKLPSEVHCWECSVLPTELS